MEIDGWHYFRNDSLTIAMCRALFINVKKPIMVRMWKIVFYRWKLAPSNVFIVVPISVVVSVDINGWHYFWSVPQSCSKYPFELMAKIRFTALYIISYIWCQSKPPQTPLCQTRLFSLLSPIIFFKNKEKKKKKWCWHFLLCHTSSQKSWTDYCHFKYPYIILIDNFSCIH